MIRQCEDMGFSTTLAHRAVYNTLLAWYRPTIPKVRYSED